MENATYFGEGVAATVWLHARGGWNLVFFSQRSKTSDKLIQVLHGEIFGQVVNVFFARVRPKGVFASLQRLHPGPKEISSYLNT